MRTKTDTKVITIYHGGDETGEAIPIVTAQGSVMMNRLKQTLKDAVDNGSRVEGLTTELSLEIVSAYMKKTKGVKRRGKTLDKLRYEQGILADKLDYVVRNQESLIEATCNLLEAMDHADKTSDIGDFSAEVAELHKAVEGANHTLCILNDQEPLARVAGAT